MSDKMPLTYADVHECVADLLLYNGKTTTLEIKNLLREIGFFATQSEVAQSMYTLWPIYGWHWTFNGTYRTYFPNLETAIEDYIENGEDCHQTSWLGWLVSPYDNQIRPPLPTTQPTAQPVAASFVDKHDLVDGEPELTSTPTKGDWLTFVYNSNNYPPAYITGVTMVTSNGGTREQARMAVRNVVRNFYSELVRVPYSDIGANVVKI